MITIYSRFDPVAMVCRIDATSLVGADLRSVNLYGANLSGMNLDSADLRGVDLTNAWLQGAKLTCAWLDGADLSGATVLLVHVERGRRPAGPEQLSDLTSSGPSVITWVSHETIRQR
jgi:hypothetical protein